jgi:hypothetical protein
MLVSIVMEHFKVGFGFILLREDNFALQLKAYRKGASTWQHGVMKIA